MVSQGSDNIYRTIIVGAGSSSANFIPEFCRAESENVRVTFIDHDLDQIDSLRRQLYGLIDDDAFNIVHINKPETARANFKSKAQELGFSYNRVNWDREVAPDTPPVIRILTHIQWDEIRRAIDEHIQKNLDGTPTAENRIIYVFGVTGMTSSTVAIEASKMYKKHLSDWAKERAATSSEEIRQIGLALMSPTPTLGISAYNIEQGYKVCSMLSEMMPDENASMEQRESFPFDNLFLIDGSGFGGEDRQDQGEFSKWSAETLAMLLYPKGRDRHGDIDTNEILGELRGYRSMALGRAGWNPDELVAVHDQVVLDESIERGLDSSEDVNAVLGQLRGDEEDVQSQLRSLSTSLDDEKEAERDLEIYNSRWYRRALGGRLEKENRFKESKEKADRVFEDLDKMVHARADKLNRMFKSRRLKFLWSTPSLEETMTLVSGRRPGEILTNFESLESAEQQRFRSERDSTLMRMIDPATDHQTMTKSIKSWEMGPPASRQILRFPKDDFQFEMMEDNSYVEIAEYDLSGDMLYSLLFWIPSDERMMPRYYRNQRNPKSNKLPEDKDAWPDLGHSTGDDVDKMLRHGDLH